MKKYLEVAENMKNLLEVEDYRGPRKFQKFSRGGRLSYTRATPSWGWGVCAQEKACF